MGLHFETCFQRGWPVLVVRARHKGNRVVPNGRVLQISMPVSHCGVGPIEGMRNEGSPYGRSPVY